MVYRLDPSDVRHAGWPLRLGAAGTDAVVDSHQIACSHFDAHRFFTPEAAPLNALTPTRESQTALEQPGCLHAGMDLYKWAHKLVPAVPSDLVLDCFELARDIRTLDMRAAPYDLRELGLRAGVHRDPGGQGRVCRRPARLLRPRAGAAQPSRRRQQPHHVDTPLASSAHFPTIGTRRKLSTRHTTPLECPLPNGPDATETEHRMGRRRRLRGVCRGARGVRLALDAVLRSGRVSSGTLDALEGVGEGPGTRVDKPPPSQGWCWAGPEPPSTCASGTVSATGQGHGR